MTMEIVLFNDVRNKKELKKQLMYSVPICNKMCTLLALLHRVMPSTAEAYYDKVVLKYLPRHDPSLLKIVRDTGNEHLIQVIEEANYYIQADLNGVEEVFENMLKEVVSFNSSIHSLEEWEQYLKDRMRLGDEVEFQRELSMQVSSQEEKKQIYKELDNMRERYLAFSK